MISREWESDDIVHGGADANEQQKRGNMPCESVQEGRYWRQQQYGQACDGDVDEERGAAILGGLVEGGGKEEGDLSHEDDGDGDQEEVL